MIGFIITRHVVSELTNKYWNESYRTIRKFYPNEIIMIIDDDSDQTFLKLEDDVMLFNCFIVRSEFPKAGEFLPYYYYLKYRLFDRAVILHDSVFFRKRIEFEKLQERNYPIWHFNQYPTDKTEDEINLLKVLDNHEQLIEFYRQKHLWKGCFGSQTFVDYDFLVSLENKYRITNLVHVINSREKRSQLERVIGCLFAFEHRELSTRSSMYGIIYKYIQWGIPYHVYQEQQGTILKQELIKVWSER